MTMLISLKDDADQDGFVEELAGMGYSFHRLEAMPNIVIITDGDLDNFPLRGHPAILFIEQDRPDAFRAQQSITLLPEHYGPWPLLRHTSRDRPWEVKGLRFPWSGEFSCVRDGTGVDVYLVDTGIRPTHTEFGGRVTVLDPEFTPLHGHGTQCASCAIGETLGWARGAKLFSAAGLRNANNTGSISDIVSALNRVLVAYNERAGLNRPGVLSLSFAGYGPSTTYQTALTALLAAGMIVCAAAANDRQTVDMLNNGPQPGQYPGVILVGGTNMADEPYDMGSHGTNFGLGIDILAGAQQIRTADFTSDTAFRTGSGTSYATPHLAGMIACLLQGYLRPTNGVVASTEVLNYLQETGTYGRVKSSPRFSPLMANAPVLAYLDPGPGPYPAIPGLVAGTPLGDDVGGNDPEIPNTSEHRYWRLQLLGSYGSLNSFASLAFFDGDTPVLPQSVTPDHIWASSVLGAGAEAHKAWDGDTATAYRSSQTDKAGWIAIDTGERTKVTRVDYTSHIYSNEVPVGFIVQGSDDKETWVDQWKFAPIPNVSKTYHRIDRPTVGHRFWGVEYTPDGTKPVDTGELAFRTEVGGPQVAVAGIPGAASTDADAATFGPAKAFDSDHTTNHRTGAAPLRLWYDFGPGNLKDIKEIGYRYANNGLGNRPMSIKVVWSDDGLEWTQAWLESTSALTWGYAQWRYFAKP